MRLMLQRLPGIRLAGTPEQQPYDRLRGLQRLPVRWDVTRVSTQTTLSTITLEICVSRPCAFVPPGAPSVGGHKQRETSW